MRIAATVSSHSANSTLANSILAAPRPKKNSNRNPWAIALLMVTMGLILGSGGYGYFRWQRDDGLQEMTRIAEQTLAEATQQLEAGNIDGAIATLNTLTLDNPLYTEAQAKVKEWRANWEADQLLMNDLQWGLDNLGRN